MAYDIQQSKRYHEHFSRALRADLDPCIVCGKGVKAPRYWVHCHYGGPVAVTPEEADELNHHPHYQGADMGCWPVGSDCLRQHPGLRPYLLKTPSAKHLTTIDAIV